MGSQPEAICAALSRLSASFERLSKNFNTLRERYQRIGEFIVHQEHLLEAPPRT